mgnify:CR=1 FL=1
MFKHVLVTEVNSKPVRPNKIIMIRLADISDTMKTFVGKSTV